ncbi:hypothetical protein CDES_14025 [Corynebacterium deserti GIMN1.010]|uniref:Secreted protein n=2 Tax=Corynebacterium TaxID=1716 RepID=A0A0M4CS72_9CORY|nr:hypothetical protein CDES_14025 [Corynebacterium deserti GIMN1.010]
MRFHGPRSLTALVTVTTIFGASALLGTTPQANALPIPLDPSDPVISELWVNPAARPNDEVSDVELEIADFAMPNDNLSVAVGENLTVQVRVTNHSSETLSNITLQAQRQEASVDVASARVAVASEYFGYFGASLTLEEDLEPGMTVDTEFEIPLDSLSIVQPGEYPVLIALSGQQNGVATHMDSQRFLLPVLGTNDTPNNTEDSPTPTTLIYPLTAQTHVLGGETGEAPEDPPLVVSSDELAQELAPTGRLTKLIDAYLQSSPQVQQATCLAIDPQLLDVVERMVDGYTVADSRRSAVRQSQRLRELWTADRDPNPGTPGIGLEDAEAFLEKLTQATANTCVVALPWANTDLNAVSQTGNQWLMREAVQRGTSTIEEVLGVTPQTNVVIPGNGFVETSTIDDLAWADSTAFNYTINEEWELQSGPPGVTGQASEQSALDNPQPTPEDISAPTPTTPVSVLVADNTVWGAPGVDRFYSLAEGITAVTYQGSLSATLATLGSNPETVGYSNPDSRYDYTLDSASARNLTGQASLRLSVGNGDADTPVLVMPSATIDADDGEMLLDTTQALIDDHTATPFTLHQYLTANAEQRTALADATAASGGLEGTSIGAPYADPAALTETEILRATQQVEYIDDLTGIMANDPSIVLTRYNFTAPLRHDLLRAMSINDRRSLGRHTDATSEADSILNDNRDALQGLRSSVALLPPGNVYTRTSESSPLIIVAQNGLPLPAETQIVYTGNQDAHINTPGVVRIPAQGSITLQMTADLPDESLRTDLTLWLASPDGATISEPVQISVQPRPNLTSTIITVVVGIVAVGGLLVLRKRRSVEKRLPGSVSPKPPPTH